jgi:hypothetical protein
VAKSITVYQRRVSALTRASTFRTVVPRDGEDGDHGYHRNMRKKCQGKTDESESYVQDREQHQPPERFESAAMRAQFDGGGDIGYFGHGTFLV